MREEHNIEEIQKFNFQKLAFEASGQDLNPHFLKYLTGLHII
jgi:hypothetical protein